MARTELTERIAGAVVTVRVDIGVLEAIAEAEDSLTLALARLQAGSYHMTRVCMRAMLASGGMDKVDDWLDRAIEDQGVAVFAALAFRALQDAFAKAAAGNGDAAETETSPDGS